MSVEVVSFGCRLNGVESDTLRRQAERAGLSNLTVVNTCAVTAEAARQGAQAVRRAARERPGGCVVVTGCAVQRDPAGFAEMPEVAAVVGNREKLRPATWAQLAAGGQDRIAVSDIMRGAEPARAVSDGGLRRVRTFVQVQTGCDHRCTFCIIPFGRGPSRSVPLPEIVAEVRALVAGGAREVVLTGVDVTAYGVERPGSPRLGTLVQAILREVPELPRLRLSSIDSVEVDPDLLAALGEEPRLMPHLHLSLQAGDDLVLRRMKRRHRRADAIAFCERVRRLRPDAVFGADLIAGFPTETEEMFGRSRELVAECGLTFLHVFPYSPRPGTPASRMPPVPRDVVKGRAAELRRTGDAALARHLAGQVGTAPRVLAENGATGRTEGFALVRFTSPAIRGEIRAMKITGQDGRELVAA